MKKISCLSILYLFLIFTAPAVADSITINTYHPAPIGIYEKLYLYPQDDAMSNPCDIGLLHVDSNYRFLYCADNGSGQGAWAKFPGTWTELSNNIFPSETSSNSDLKVSIGGNIPDSLLHLEGTGYPTLRINNAANQSNSKFIFEEGGQGNNLEIRYRTLIDATNNWVEFWGLVKAAPNTPIMTLVRDNNFGSDPTEFGAVGIGVPNEYYPTAQLEVRNFATEDIMQLENSAGDAVMRVIDGGHVGIGTPEPANIIINPPEEEFKLTLDNDGGILAKGIYNSGATLSTVQTGSRLIWMPRQGSFSAGTVDTSLWGPHISTVSLGQNNNPQDVGGNYTTAIGTNNRITGNSGITIGNNNRVTVSNGIAIGMNNLADFGFTPVTVGYNNTAHGNYAGALGTNLATNSGYSFSLGSNITNTGNNSFAVGLAATPSGTLAQSNAMAIMGGNVGINTPSPMTVSGTSVLHVNDVVRLEPRAAAPTCNERGMIYADSAGTMCFCDGTAWHDAVSKLSPGNCS